MACKVRELLHNVKITQMRELKTVGSEISTAFQNKEAVKNQATSKTELEYIL